MKHALKTRFRLLCALALTLILTGPVLGDPGETVSLEFTDAPILTVLETIGTAGDFKFEWDDKFDAQAKTSVSLSEIPVLDALRFVTRSNDLFYVASGPKTVLIAPDTRQKRQEHMPQGTRTFQLDRADPKNVITVLRSLLQTRQLVHDERLNTITMKDTPGQLDIAAEVIDRMDHESGTGPGEPLWVGNAFNQDMLSIGDSIPRLEVDMERVVKLDPDASVARDIYAALSKAAGIQFIFDRRIDLDKQASFVLAEASAQETLEVVNRQFEHFSVVWGPRTIFITLDVDWKRMIEEPVAIQFFYLSHADPRSVITSLRSLLQTRQLAEIPRLRAVVIKDTVAQLEAAQEIVEGMDRADR